MISAIISLYSPSYAPTIIYMLQNTEYQAAPYLRWYWRTGDFRQVMYRRKLDKTRAASLLLLALMCGMILQVVGALVLIWLWNTHGLVAGWAYGLALLISYPIVWAHLIVVPLVLGRILIVWPRNRRLIKKSRAIFAHTKAVKIAVAGSYGKTSMKELLKTVLSEGKRVAATPANKNVASSHAKFAAKLQGDEEILIIEYGEDRPGSVAKFAATTQPNIGVITGLAPAHLDHYPTLEAAGQDIFSLADYLDGQNVYVNKDSKALESFMKPGYESYDSEAVMGWKISNIKIAVTGTSFTMQKGKTILKLHSKLLGRHNVGPLALAAALGDKLGLTKAQIEDGVGRTAPFEHRMEPRQLGGAWIIDDTYNGNIEGIRAGLELLKTLKSPRKTYITPGLVDQGVETERVHTEMGKLIANSKPDRVILMKNSVTKYIQQGLEAVGYKGGLALEEDPLGFYNNLDQFVAAGDLILMQNDWTDNYA